jgi:hypothetical protein
VSIVVLLMLAGCGLSSGQAPAHLAFEAPMNVDSGQRFHVSLGVRNVGETRFRAYESFNGAMALREAGGEEVGSIRVATLWELAPGGAGWPAAYAAKLPAGAYQLTWSAPAYGSVTVDFTLVELDGWLYLGKESILGTEGETPAEDERPYGALQSLVDLARVNLAQKLGVEPEAITVQGIEEVEFADASLGVPEPGKRYAQVISPGYAIELVAQGQTYEYRASDKRLVFAAGEESVAQPQGSITIEGVQVTAGEEIFVRGRSTLLDGACLGSELWADGALQAWWPGETCVVVEDGTWQMAVPLGANGAPAELDRSAHYMLRAFQQGGPDVVSVFAFDLSGPPTPAP